MYYMIKWVHLELAIGISGFTTFYVCFLLIASQACKIIFFWTTARARAQVQQVTRPGHGPGPVNKGRG